MKVPITKAVFEAEDFALIQKPLETGWVVQGPWVKQFEEKFAEFTKAAHAVAVSSCTTGLHVALEALGIGPGDEVVVPAFTWVATANVVEYVGARPVFCDVELQTFNLDVAELERKVTPRTRAIIPVHLFGLAADMGPIMDLARRKKLRVVEDAACGFASYYQDRHVGTFGDFGCFSFHPRKAITTGEGGMNTTQDPALAQAARTLRDHGASRSDLSRHGAKNAFLLAEYNVRGFNYRMTDIQGALGVAQMNKAADIQRRRVSWAQRYDDKLQGLGWLRLPTVPRGFRHGYQSYVTLFAPKEPSLANLDELFEARNEMMIALEERGISTRQGTHAVTTLGYYTKKYGIRPEDFPRALIADHLTVTLPVYATMTAEEHDFVVENLKSWK
ncbi:MAG: DegT/DnrJ/EryC1/StrS family aminotransferase [Myxococcales bacterium]|nr:DegT/DnrJ/EryC1/StrS family aminotransferase [Myxococcales bacterium]